MKNKILITGGAGFIGSHIVDLFIKKGHKVVVIDNLSRGTKKNLNSKAKFYQIDLLSPRLNKVFEKEKPEIIIHEAAQVNVRASIKDPKKDARINIYGAINLFSQAAKYKVKKIIYASSGGAIYGEPKYLPVDEKHPIEPLSPYGVSKYTVELYLRYFAKMHSIPYTILRYANVYGPRQDLLGEAGVVAIFINKFLHNETPLIFGDGKQTRDFVYVGDVARANYLAYKLGVNEEINIGTGKKTSVLDIFNLLNKEFKKDIKPEFKEAVAGEVRQIILDNKKAKKVLGFTPQIDFESGLKKTIDWAKSTQK